METKGNTKLVAAGYICGFGSLLIFPPGLGLAGVVIGILNLGKGEVGHGIAQIVIGITCGYFGMCFGIAVM